MLSSAGFLEGFSRGKANLDMELISRHSEGVLALTGCLQSRFCRRIVEDRPDDARAHIDDLIQVFGAEQVYFELQRNGIAEQDKANEGIVKVARELGRPLVGTADVHYLTREDYDNHAALLCVQTKSTVAEPKLSFDTNEFFLKSPEEMAADFAEWPEAIPTTLEIAERCEVEMELGKLLLPRYETPEGVGARADAAASWPSEGLAARYGDPVPAEARERLEFELGVIEEMGFESYFLIVWDFVRYAKENGIAVGPGRGSAAGSIVAYALDITDIDPIANDLLFERFLNPGRKSMPDIDIDFSVRGPRAGDPLRPGQVRARVRRADHHLRQDGPARGDPRRRAGAGLRLRSRRPAREADPRADHGPQPELRRVPAGRTGAAPHLRLRARREEDHRRRQGPRGDRPQQLDPRRRRRDLRPPAPGDRPAAARRGPRRRRGRRRTGTGTAASPSAPTRWSPSTRWARSRRSAC